MPDQSSAADEHALLQEITDPLSTLPAHAPPAAIEPSFTIVLRGYERAAVDEYVQRTSLLVAELQATQSPEAAVRRALEQVGEQISGILQRAHDTASQITAQSRAEAEDRLETARKDAHELTSGARLEAEQLITGARLEAEQLTTEARLEAEELTAGGRRRVVELDADADRIWAERRRIVEDARALALDLQSLAESAAERFPSANTEENAVLGAQESDEGGPGPVPSSPDPAPGAPAPFDPDATVAFERQRDPAADDASPPKA